nr:protein FAR1-related sequence 5-like [Tanacetum cinerariifolium]
MTEGGDSNNIRSTYDEVDEKDEVFRSDYTEIDNESEKLEIGSEYSTIDKCIKMYAKYAEKSRVIIRKSTQEKLKSGIPARKYLLCNKEGLPKDNFSFEYVVENSQLSALFWADEMSKYNYKEFGDTISFDATFRTNKYNMVFVPFTGIDNHRKCVTFGAGMLSNETTKSYKWLLTCFRKAFNKQPRLVITDQDPAAKNAIASVLNESTHKLCMWHITNKLSLKVSTDKSDGSVLCSCMNFVRFGFLCRHIFCVLKGNGLEVIPDKYILKRWTRNLLPPHIRRKTQMFGFECGRYMECSATVYSAVDYCLKLLAKDEDKLLEFVEYVKKLKTKVEEANPNTKQLSKKEMFNLVLGVEKPEVNTVKNPKPCSNKGNASRGQRKKSEIDKLREHMKKHRRLCKKCEKYRRHDSRNCPKKDDEIPTDSDSTVVSE